MLKFYTIHVPEHRWGSVFQQDFLIPIEADKVVGIGAYIQRSVSHINATTRSLCTVSASTDNGDIIHAGLPVQIAAIPLTKRMEPVDNLPAGRQLRLVLEEMNDSPFTQESNAYDLKVYIHYTFK